MSPTDAMLMRIPDLSGSGGGGGRRGSAGAAGSVSGGGAGAGSGAVAQAASSDSDSASSSDAMRALVVTEPDTQYIDLRSAQAAAQQVQFVEILGRADVDAVVVAVIDLDALDV